MAGLIITDELKAKAEVYYGDETCQQCLQLLLKEAGLPNGLLPLKDVTECGYVEETGYVWLKQRKRVDHCFQSIGRRLVSYGTDITGYAEKGRIRNVKGIKTRELLLWVPVEEIALLLDDDQSVVATTGTKQKLVCKSVAGICKTFPASAFHVPEMEEEDVKKTMMTKRAAAAALKPVVLMDRTQRAVVSRNK